MAMLVIIRALILGSALVHTSAMFAGTDEPAAKILIWVGHTFMGGPKCTTSGPVSHYQSPGFEAEKLKLARHKVTPRRDYHRDIATCEACHKCPVYHREILFEIRAEQIDLAEKAGYRKVQPPAYDELKEYEDAKRFRPKPDGRPRDD